MWNSNQPKPRGEFHMMMKLLMSNTQGVRTYLGLFQVIMANVAGRHGRGRLVGVWRRVRFSQKVNFRGVETEFRSNWTPYEWLPSGRYQKIKIGWAVDGSGYLKMPRRLEKKYFHRQLLEDFGLARAGHEMVTHHVDGDLQQLVRELGFHVSSRSCPRAFFWRGSLRGKCVFRLLWSSQRILVLNRGIYLGSDLDCDGDGDTFFGSMRPHTQVNSKLSPRSPSRGRKEQKLFCAFGRNSANTGGVWNSNQPKAWGEFDLMIWNRDIVKFEPTQNLGRISHDDESGF